MLLLKQMAHLLMAQASIIWLNAWLTDLLLYLWDFISYLASTILHVKRKVNANQNTLHIYTKC